MNRKSFFRNLFGAVAATAIGSTLDFIPEPQPIKPLPLVNRMKRYKKEWSVGEEKNVVVQNGVWFKQADWEAMQAFSKERERWLWYGSKEPINQGI